MITDALQQTSGLVFRERWVYARSGNFDEVHSGWPGRKAMAVPLCVRDNSGLHYAPEIEYVGTVSHELGHRLLLEHGIVAPPGKDHHYEAHQHLYLFLLDAWRMAYGAASARLLKKAERRGGDDYQRAMRWAEALGIDGRRKHMVQLVKQGKLTRPLG